MDEILARLDRQDMEIEYQLRLQLRETLWVTLHFLTDIHATENDKNRVIALINQTLEESAP